MTDWGPDLFWCKMMRVELPHQPSCAVLDHTVVVRDADTIGNVATLDRDAHSIGWMVGQFPQYVPEKTALQIRERSTSNNGLPRKEDHGIQNGPRGDCLVQASS